MMVETRARHSYFRVSPDGTRIASVDGAGRIFILASDDLTVLDEFESSGAVVNRIEYSPDGRRLLTACQDGFARLIDATDGTVVEELLHTLDCFEAVGGSVDHVDFELKHHGFERHQREKIVLDDERPAQTILGAREHCRA